MPAEFQEMIPVETAVGLISASMPSYPAVTLPLSKCHGRILREPIRADREQPPFNRVAMDGFAVAFPTWERGFRRFIIEGRQKAGETPRRLVSELGCIEVMTGAVMPEGTDCVIPVEEIEISGNAAVVTEPAKPKRPMQHVHRAGSDCSGGDVVAPEGVVLTSARIGAAAAFGLASLPVAYSPSVAIIATGDELVDPSKTPTAHQIRRSNSYAIEAALRQRHIERVALLHSRDEPARLRTSLESVLGKCDVLILTGGVSMGKTDHVPAALKDLGIKPIFHRVRQKPGKPFWFGVGAGGKPVFALPGNPASVLVCLYRYVLPGLREAMGGAPEPALKAMLEEEAPAPGTLTQFRPVTLRTMESGALGAAFVTNQGSGDFTGWARCDGFVELAAGESLPKGTPVPVYLW